ncbi:MAG: hypothetical protein QOG88_264 [Actinomycetota bacterium]|nr:hypothetical protein [Actinomycetota bacterium]
MISWRYHVVSIVAVFLALALGVLAGTAVVNQSLINNLKRTTETLTQDFKDNSATIKDLRTEVAYFTDFSDQAMKNIVSARLTGVDVVLVTDDGADPAALDEVRGVLALAGANVVTTLTPLQKLVSADPTDAKNLENIIGAPAQTDPSNLPGLVAQTLADRLAHGPALGLHPGQQDVILANLLSEGFIDSGELKVAEDLRIPTAVVVVGGPAEGQVTSPATFMVPLVQALSAQGVVVAAGEARPSPNGFVATVRQDGAGPGPRVTVDDLEGSIGGTALAVGLQRAIDQRVGGDYGVGSGRLVMPPLT